MNLGTKKVDTDVESHIRDLEHQFRQLHENLLTELEDTRVTVTKLLRSLTVLPAEIQDSHYRDVPRPSQRVHNK